MLWQEWLLQPVIIQKNIMDKEDKDYVVKSFAKLIEAGVYQKDLFEDTPSLFEKNFILPKEREEGIAVGN